MNRKGLIKKLKNYLRRYESLFSDMGHGSIDAYPELVDEECRGIVRGHYQSYIKYRQPFIKCMQIAIDALNDLKNEDVSLDIISEIQKSSEVFYSIDSSVMEDLYSDKLRVDAALYILNYDLLAGGIELNDSFEKVLLDKLDHPSDKVVSCQRRDQLEIQLLKNAMKTNLEFMVKNIQDELVKSSQRGQTILQDETVSDVMTVLQTLLDTWNDRMVDIEIFMYIMRGHITDVITQSVQLIDSLCHIFSRGYSDVMEDRSDYRSSSNLNVAHEVLSRRDDGRQYEGNTIGMRDGHPHLNVKHS